MSANANNLADGVVLTGSQFSEPMRIVGNPTTGDERGARAVGFSMAMYLRVVHPVYTLRAAAI